MKRGRFLGEVETRWLPDGRDMELLRTFAYIDKYGDKWEAPNGSVINGASIPRSCWTLVGGPYTAEYRVASVVHDVYCTTMEKSWQSTHRMFFDAMIDSYVDERQAKLMFAAVWHFGPRWTDGKQLQMTTYSAEYETLERWQRVVPELMREHIEELSVIP